MAARKRTKSSSRTKRDQTQSVPSRKQAAPASSAKTLPRKTVGKPARERAAAAGERVAVRPAAPVKGRAGATKVALDIPESRPLPDREAGTPRGTAGPAVEARSNGGADARLQTTSLNKTRHQALSQESPLKFEKIDPVSVPGTKATESSGAAGSTSTTKPAQAANRQKPAARDEAPKAAKPSGQRQGFRLSEFVVYPAHGVGQIVAIEEQEVAGFKLELFVIAFAKDKMTLRVPTSKVAGVGMRKISDPDTARRSLDILSGRARVKRTMWSRRAQEYETKINSGDIAAIAEVVRDLYRSEAQPEQSYSERQLYEAALDRMVREIAAVQKTNEIDALKAIEAQLQKTHARQAKAGSTEAADPEIEEAA